MPNFCFFNVLFAKVPFIYAFLRIQQIFFNTLFFSTYVGSKIVKYATTLYPYIYDNKKRAFTLENIYKIEI